MDPVPFASIGNRLAKLRRGFSRMSQKDWVLSNGFEITQYNNWERGSRRIPIDSAMALCHCYGVTLDYIYAGRIDGVSMGALVRLGFQPADLAAHLVEVVGDDGLEPPTFSV